MFCQHLLKGGLVLFLFMLLLLDDLQANHSQCNAMPWTTEYSMLYTLILTENRLYNHSLP
jgi:hypothetical protein